MRVTCPSIVLMLLCSCGCKTAEHDDERPSVATKPSHPDPEVAARTAERAGNGPAAQTRSTAALPVVALEKVVDGLVAPTNLVTAPDGTMIVLEQEGLLQRIESGTLKPFGDLRDRVVRLDRAYDERGLLGLAFHPDFPKNRYVYAYYSAPLRRGAPRAYDHTNVLSRFEVSADDRLDASSEKKLLQLDWPAPNHDGGTLAFGPDRMLYVSMGDGGSAADIGRGHPPAGNGQDWTTLMGSILRIDPDGGDPYGIPADNPFAGDHPGADEIWAYGLRNPYAFSFDPADGTLFTGDVGQDLVEEVDIIERGQNYGWSIKEGTLCFDQDHPDRPANECGDEGVHGEPLVGPIVWYAQPDSVVAERSEVHGISVIGGNVYRGRRVPQLQGVYVFGDWSLQQNRPRGVLLAARKGDDGWAIERLRVKGISGPDIGMYVRAFGQDAAGEVYVLTSEREGIGGRTGVVWKLGPG